MVLSLFFLESAFYHDGRINFLSVGCTIAGGFCWTYPAPFDGLAFGICIPTPCCSVANFSIFFSLASNEVKASMSHHHHTPSSQPLSSPVEVRPAHDQYSAFPLQSVSNSKSLMMHHEIDSQPSTLNSNSSWIKEEGEDKTIALFGDVPEGKRRKFILVDDHARGTRVRVRVLLDSVKMEEMPDSHLRTNSVFPRSYYPRQMNSPPASPGRSGNWDDCDSGEESVASSASERARTTVQVVLLDGSQSRLRVPRMSRMRRRKELALNELGYRMSWSQAKTFNERPIFMQKSRESTMRPTDLMPVFNVLTLPNQSMHIATRPDPLCWLLVKIAATSLLTLRPELGKESGSVGMVTGEDRLVEASSHPRNEFTTRINHIQLRARRLRRHDLHIFGRLILSTTT